MDMSDLTTSKLYQSSREYLDAGFPDGLDLPEKAFAVSFKEDSKELWLYDIDLNPKVKNYVPPKRVLKSEGDLEFYSLMVNDKEKPYLLFIEVGHKLLFYNYTENEFVFVTEDKFTDPYLLATPAGELYLAYIDHHQILRFRHLIQAAGGR
jgi:hypothetical protein